MKIHIVKEGDTLYELSKKYNVPLQTLIDANPQFSDPNVLTIGQKVKIPAEPVQVPSNNENIIHKHVVNQGDSLWKLSKAWGVTLKDMIEANPQLKNPNALLVGEVVNIPNAGTSANENHGASVNENHDKTVHGSKTYTGPKENTAPKAEMTAPNVVMPKQLPEIPNIAPLPNIMPNMVMPEHVKPNMVMPEHVKPNMVMPEHMKPNMVMPEHMKPNMMMPEHVMPNMMMPEHVMPNMMMPEHVMPNMMMPENMMPNMVMPEHMKPNMMMPAVEAPCGCGDPWHHENSQHPYTSYPVPAQEAGAFYSMQYEQTSYYPGIVENAQYEDCQPNSQWVSPYMHEGPHGENQQFPMHYEPNQQFQMQYEPNQQFPMHHEPNMHYQPMNTANYSYNPCGCSGPATTYNRLDPMYSYPHNLYPQHEYPAYGWGHPSSIHGGNEQPNMQFQSVNENGHLHWERYNPLTEQQSYVGQSFTGDINLNSVAVADTQPEDETILATNEAFAKEMKTLSSNKEKVKPNRSRTSTDKKDRKKSVGSKRHNPWIKN